MKNVGQFNSLLIQKTPQEGGDIQKTPQEGGDMETR